MTLSLDDIQAKRFRMARKNGYEVSEVDEFVDEVEETVAQLVAQAENLKKQVDALQQTGSSGSEASPAAGPVQQMSPAGGIVVSTTKEASAAVVRLVELSTEQAERLVAEASEEAERTREEADRIAQQVTGDAKAHAERLETDARAAAERLEAQAAARAEEADRELQERRRRMFGELEVERQRLLDAVGDLRRFEAEYRSTLLEHLHAQIRRLEDDRAEPAERPNDSEGADDGEIGDRTDQVDPPRVDAALRGGD